MALRNIISFSSKVASTGLRFRQSIGIPSSSSTLIQKNPILNQSNRIVTVGLLSSYSCRGKQGQSLFSSLPSSSFSSSSFTTSKAESEVVQSTPEVVQSTAKVIGNRQPSLNISKPHIDTQKGCLLRLAYNYNNRTVIVTAAPQKGEKLPQQPHYYSLQFDWNSKVSIVISLFELGRLLAVLSGSTNEAIVQTALSQVETSVKLSLSNKANSYIVNLLKEVDGKNVSNMQTTLEPTEVVVLVEFLRCSIRSGLGFL